MRHLLSALVVFTTVLSSYAQSGTISKSFGIDGTVITSFQQSINFTELGNQVLLQEEGKIVVIFNQRNTSTISIARYLINGTLDTTFGINGYTQGIGPLFHFKMAVMTSDGSIILGGTYLDDLGFVRYTKEGLFDKEFGNNGFLSIDFGSTESLKSIEVTADDKIVAIGLTSSDENSSLIIARLSGNGKLDKKFNKDGKLTLDLQLVEYSVSAVSIQSDNKIVIGGNAIVDNVSNALLVRINEKGSIDTSFGDAGISVVPSSNILSIAFQKDGKIVAIDALSILRYNQSGLLDASFGTVGKQPLNSTTNPIKVVIQDDSKILVCGTFVFGTIVTRYNPDGGVDVSYGSGDGRAIVMPIRSTYPSSMILQPNGKTIITGYNAPFVSGTQYFVLRLNESGLLDMNFQQKGLGLLASHYASGNSTFDAIAVQKDGKIIAAGRSYVPSNSSQNSIIAARYMENGSLDTSFANAGKLIYPVSFSQSGNAELVLPDTGFVISNYQSLQGFNSLGKVDANFGIGGKLITGFSVSSAAAFQDGKILALGENSASKIVLGKYLRNGSPDNSFGNNGTLALDFTKYWNTSKQVFAIQNDGKILVTGSRLNGTVFEHYIIRLNSNGSFDETFDNDGKLLLAPTGESFLVSSIAVQEDGKIILAGSTYLGDQRTIALSRLNPNGTTDKSFGSIGTLYTDLKFEPNTNSCVILKNGNILLGGTDNIIADFAIASFTKQGKIDRSFGNEGVLTTDIAVTSERASAFVVSGNHLYQCGQTTAQPISNSLIVAYKIPGYSNKKSENRINEGATQSTDKLKAIVLNNPTNKHFTIKIESDKNLPIQLRVTDLGGRIVHQQKNVSAFSSIQFGGNYLAGTYYMQVTQGLETLTIKLVKQ